VVLKKQVRVVGLIRFSMLFGEHPFKKGKGMAFPDLVKMIMSEERLLTRFHLFQTVCLPSLDAQRSDEFKVLLISSRFMPRPWQERLRDLIASRGHLEVVFADEDSTVANEAGRFVADGLKAGPVASFRLDDDDALASDYIESLAAYLNPANVGSMVSFSSGYYLQIDGPDQTCKLAEVHVPKLSAGMAMISRATAFRNVYKTGTRHNNVDLKWPVILDGRRPMFLMTSHGENDSGRGESARLGKLEWESPETAANTLAARFPTVDVARLVRGMAL